ncbi:MAG TPA: aminotransferase class IV [Moheibacter sp.]|nr:aminotransferase class IV [Moheibacter sp.]
MSRLIESICIQNGEIRNLEFHQERVNRSRWKLFGLNDELNLKKYIEPHLVGESKAKCRILYGEKTHLVEMNSYEIRKIHSVKLIESNEIDYRFKFEDRTAFELMKDSVEEDEIIIVKNGKITDTSYSNLVFFDGENWITPKTFLLNGTMRQYLLNSNQIIEKEVFTNDLKNFQTFKLINAMMNLEESPALDISVIV